MRLGGVMQILQGVKTPCSVRGDIFGWNPSSPDTDPVLKGIGEDRGGSYHEPLPTRGSSFSISKYTRNFFLSPWSSEPE